MSLWQELNYLLYLKKNLICNHWNFVLVEDCYGKEKKCATGLNVLDPKLMRCYNSYCNNIKDCEDGSDEQGCDYNCGPNAVRCLTG